MSGFMDIFPINVGDKVIKVIPDLGNISAKVISIKDLGKGFVYYDLELLPNSVREKTLIEGMLSYDKKYGAFWGLEVTNNGSVISRNNNRGMFNVAFR